MRFHLNGFRMFILFTLIFILIIQCNQDSKTYSFESELINRSDSIEKYMADVNSFYFAILLPDGEIIEKYSGQNNNNEPVNKQTIFEGASLSKTITAFIFWRLQYENQKYRNTVILKSCDDEKKAMPISPFRLLRHSMQTSASCIINDGYDSFAYSENNYLLLQKIIENQSGLSLEALAKKFVFDPFNMSRSSFIWKNENTDFVDGYYDKQRHTRGIHQFYEPKSNGSLYTSGSDLLKFSKTLLKSEILDSIRLDKIRVSNFNHLFWGRGMGIDIENDDEYFWQWGCNWEYNHVLILNQRKNFAIIALTNSLLGSKAIQHACNYVINSDLQLFNYINKD